MRLAIAYDPKSSKLIENTYSMAYRDMWKALIARFDEVVHITEETDMNGINADVIIIYDIHSSHHLTLKGIREHKAIKYTYYNDPWQREQEGVYWYNQRAKFHKLGQKDRAERTLKRGINYIICPSQYGYWNFMAPHLGNERAGQMLVWFPIGIDIERFDFNIPVSERKKEIMLNGHLWVGEAGWRPYKFRRWVYEREIFTNVPHVIEDSRTPDGLEFSKLLSEYAGACAFCDMVTIPKHSEVPAAGCACFLQENYDTRQMGFRDMVNCVYINKGNARKRVRDFINNISDYQPIADAGRKLILENWTSKHFADFIYNHAREKYVAA